MAYPSAPPAGIEGKRVCLRWAARAKSTPIGRKIQSAFAGLAMRYMDGSVRDRTHFAWHASESDRVLQGNEMTLCAN